MKILWNDIDSIKDIINTSYTRGEVLKRMGCTSAATWNRNKLSDFIKKHNIDAEHLRKKRPATILKISTDDIFCKNSIVAQATVKKYFLSTVIEPKCTICKIDQWMGVKLSLHLDHINGCNTDNRLENLRLLCPNCHTITPTFGRKNKKGDEGILVLPSVCKTDAV